MFFLSPFYPAPPWGREGGLSLSFVLGVSSEGAGAVAGGWVLVWVAGTKGGEKKGGEGKHKSEIMEILCRRH